MHAVTADPFSKIKKLAVKGGAVVDPDSGKYEVHMILSSILWSRSNQPVLSSLGLSKTHHVYESGGIVYNAVLGLVDIVQGTNSFYKLQILEADSSKKCPP